MRVFTHNSEKWLVEYGGGGTGVSSVVPDSGDFPAVTSHVAYFRKDGTATRYVGWLRTKDVDAVSEAELETALEAALAENRTIK